MNSATRFKKARDCLGFTQQELANKLGFKQFKIKDIETEKQKVSPEIAESMEKNFSINGWWLLTGKGEMLQDTTTVVHVQLSQQEAEIIQDYRVLEKDDQDIFYHELKTAALKARKKAKDTNLKDNQ